MTTDQLLAAVITAALFVLRDALDRELRRRGARRTRHPEDDHPPCQDSDTEPQGRSEV